MGTVGRVRQTHQGVQAKGRNKELENQHVWDLYQKVTLIGACTIRVKKRYGFFGKPSLALSTLHNDLLNSDYPYSPSHRPAPPGTQRDEKPRTPPCAHALPLCTYMVFASTTGAVKTLCLLGSHWVWGQLSLGPKIHPASQHFRMGEISIRCHVQDLFQP